MHPQIAFRRAWKAGEHANMDDTYKVFQEQFPAFVDAFGGLDEIVRRTGYSRNYVRWVLGDVGLERWPGSRRFVEKMQALGMQFELPPKPVTVTPCSCGAVHLTNCRTGKKKDQHKRSQDPEFLRLIQEQAVPFLRLQTNKEG